MITSPRNEPCPCGSTKKFKKCCGTPAALHQARVAVAAARLEKRRAARQQEEAKAKAEGRELPRLTGSQMLGIAALICGGLPMRR
jgi:hypothetical protein